MRRRLIVWFAIVAAVLVLSASPASASTAIGSQNTTASDFQAGTLNEFAVTGSGTAASAVTGNSTYNPVTDQGDGTTDASLAFIGDMSDDDPINSEVLFKPTTTGTIDELDVDIGTVFGSDYGYTVDIYIVQEDVDGGYGEGTLVKSGWDPTHTGGEQTIALDTGFDVDAGTEYTIEFITDSSDGDGNSDFLSIKTDTSASGSWYNNGGLFHSDYADVTGRYVNDVDTAEYISSTHNVSEATTGFVNLSVSSSTVTIDWLADTDGDGSFETTVKTDTYTSGGNKTASLSSVDADAWRAKVTGSATGTSAAVKIHSDGVVFDSRAPTLSNPTPANGTQLSRYSGNVTVDVSDAEFGTVQGDTVTVEATAANGTTLGSTTVSSNSTVSFSYRALAGANTISWEASDAYGSPNATLTQEFATPARIYMRNEKNPSQPIEDSGTAEVTFFSETTVETRPITDGTANLSGLPADETFVAVVKMDGYYQRRILIDSLFEQQRVFLLNESKTAVDVEFELDDSTGQFSSGDVELTVEKAIIVNNSTEFRAVVGDRISASGGLPASLEEGARYRLTVSKDGNTRSLGSWTASSGGFVTLPIGRVELEGDVDDEGWLLEHSIDDPPEGSNADGLLRLKYVDKSNRTESLETQVVRLNDSGGVAEVVLANATETGTQSVVRSVEVNNTSDTFEVRYTLTRDGETISASRQLGSLEGINLPVPAGWLNLISWVAVFGFGGLIVIKDSRAAALVMAGSASLLGMLGWLQAPTAVLALASGGAVVYAVAGRGGGF